MTIQDFNCLTIEKRAELVKESGKHLFSHLEHYVSSHFYQIDDFSVEVWIDSTNGNVMGVEPIRRLAA